MAVAPVRMVLTNSNNLNPAYTVPSGLKAIVKSIQVTNGGAADALFVLSVTGGFDIARINISSNQTIVIDTAQVLNTSESLTVTVTGGTTATSVHTMISGVTF